jgi:signal peptidase I
MSKSIQKKLDFFDRIQLITEEKSRAKGRIWDWIESFLWAVCMVLLINQYFVQAYRIPSGSMEDTLNIGDNIFVNKIVYGPELLPGFLKLPSPVKPKRNDIIIFESITYRSRGTIFDIFQRLIFYITFGQVDIDRDERGQQRVRWLVKRAVGQSQDHLKIENGEVKIRFAGEDRWIDEREYNAQRGWNHNINRIVTSDQYPVFAAAGQRRAWEEVRLPVSRNLEIQTSQFESFRVANSVVDRVAFNRARLETLRKAVPHNRRYARDHARDHLLGWYVPEGRVFPLGDNRDNSHDGRDYGPVRKASVLGRGMIIYFPFNRLGSIN